MIEDKRVNGGREGFGKGIARREDHSAVSIVGRADVMADVIVDGIVVMRSLAGRK